MIKKHVFIAIGPLMQRNSGKPKKMEVHDLGQDATSLSHLFANKEVFLCEHLDSHEKNMSSTGGSTVGKW